MTAWVICLAAAWPLAVWVAACAWRVALACLRRLGLWPRAPVRRQPLAWTPVTSTPPAELDHHPRAKPRWAVERVLYLAVHLSSCRAVAYAFNQWPARGQNLTIGKTTAAKIIKAHEAEIAEMHRAMRRRPPPHYPTGHTWALDLTSVPLQGGKRATLLAIIDSGSRRLLCLRVLMTKCAYAVLGCVLLAISHFGKPRQRRTDNEGMFVSRLWRKALTWLRIRHRRGPPRQPWRNGRIERFFGTLKPLLKRLRITSVAMLAQRLDEFKAFYNEVRPHQALQGLTPQQAWQGLTVDDVRQANAKGQGEWVLALDGLMVGIRMRC